MALLHIVPPREDDEFGTPMRGWARCRACGRDLVHLYVVTGKDQEGGPHEAPDGSDIWAEASIGTRVTLADGLVIANRRYPGENLPWWRPSQRRPDRSRRGSGVQPRPRTPLVVTCWCGADNLV